MVEAVCEYCKGVFPSMCIFEFKGKRVCSNCYVEINGAYECNVGCSYKKNSKPECKLCLLSYFKKDTNTMPKIKLQKILDFLEGGKENEIKNNAE